MSWQRSETAPVTFLDVVASFSEDEWKLLHEWQKELYSNVMKDIQQALISLGPVIAHSVFSLRVKETETPCPLSNDSSDSIRIVSEPTRSEAVTPVFSYAVKEEEHIDYLDHHDPGHIGDIRDPSGFNYLATETGASDLIDLGAEGGESEASSVSGFNVIPSEAEKNIDTDGDYGIESSYNLPSDPSINTQMLPCNIKKEGQVYFIDDHDYERKESVDVHRWSGRMGRQKKTQDPLLGNKTIPSRDLSVNPSMNVFESPESTMYSRSQLWSENNEELEGETLTQFESDFESPSYSGLYPGMCKVEWDAECDERESNIINAMFLSGQLNTTLNGTWHTCTECGKGFSQRRNLLRHQIIHRGERLHQCTQCDKRFSRKLNLLRHQRMHTGKRLYQCSECEKSFNLKRHLIVHERAHAGQRTYECDTCQQSFHLKADLVSHQAVHMTKRPYQCALCGKGFTGRTNLMVHERIHTHEKPYQCNFCQRRFSQKGNLIVHRRTHTGEKPYKCQECPKSFIQKVNLIAHKTAHARRRRQMSKNDVRHKVFRGGNCEVEK